MKTVRSINSIRTLLETPRKRGRRIGFVPTMGAFHKGHISLIEKADKENDIVVVSVFVNPAQFGPKEDYARYPREIKQDRQKAKNAGCDILFYPDAVSMYPQGYKTYVEVDELSGLMCGKSRPGHFKGVATVCAKLFNIIMPDTAYFGKKDFQQAVIIKRMAGDLNMHLKIKMLPIVRQGSGLAMSSRNRYLSLKQKEDAALIYRSLKNAEKMIRSGVKDVSKIKSDIRSMLRRPGIKIDYISIASPVTLKQVKFISGDTLIALAVKVGSTRLIDNVLVKLKGTRHKLQERKI